MERGFFFESASGVCFPNEVNRKYILGLLNSKVVQAIAEMLNPTATLQSGDLARVPVLKDNNKFEQVNRLVEDNIKLSMMDWDSYEISWDFKGHPLVLGRLPEPVWGDVPDKVAFQNTSIPYTYRIYWKKACEYRFEKLKANEEELNRIFIDIYGLQDELTPEVEDKNVTVRRADLTREIKSLLSYAVGCLFGRYSLDVDGLVYAGGEWDDSKYVTLKPVTDNVLPLCDEEYFGENDLVNRIVEFVRVVYGADTLEENLAFIAKALGNKGNTSREIIRNYFLKDFFADHCKIYQKRPIYWMFDSGKKNGFKALVYLHRWDADTTGRVYNNYLSPLLRTYAQQIVQENNVISSSNDARTVSTAQKRLDKLKLQQEECEKYEKNIAHLAALRITLDLDDGVKVNYVKAQTAADGKNLNVLAPIK